jgi:hypothetical protein
VPRYLVERHLAGGVDAWEQDGNLPRTLETNARIDVTWLHSYVSADRRRMYCLYEARTPEAVRHAAALSGLPVEAIIEVVLLDPYAYRAPRAASGCPRPSSALEAAPGGASP